MLYAQAKLPEGVKGANAFRACIAVILACTPIMPKIYWDNVHLGKIAIGIQAILVIALGMQNVFGGQIEGLLYTKNLNWEYGTSNRGQMMGTDANKMVRDIKDRLYPSCPPIANQYLARPRISIFALFCVISIFLCYVLLTATVHKSRGFIWAKL